MTIDAGLGAGYVRTDKAHHNARKVTLKQGRTFGLFDTYGDLASDVDWDLGVYHAGTRVLSRFELLLDGEHPLLLSSSVDRDNLALNADLTNPDLHARDEHDDSRVLMRGALHLGRRMFLAEGALLQEFRWRSYADEPVEIGITYRFAADFADIFEVRGLNRQRRGAVTSNVPGPRQIEFRYLGLDGVERLSALAFSGTPDVIGENEARFLLRIEPQQHLSQYVTAVFGSDGDRSASPATFARRYEELKKSRGNDPPTQRRISSSNALIDDALDRASADLRMLRTDLPEGPYPFAGIPWFSTVFGRDGLWTALFCTWLDPAIAKGVLGVLADTQATAVSLASEAEPGKIVHEMREGEMAALGEVPFARYYGTVDATPLFVMLADAHLARTDDAAFCERLWPNVKAALDWMEHYGDADGDGFIEYARQSEDGLINQGWKDSHDAIFHADGSMATGSIALCEVQGYAYAAWLGAARMAARLGRADDAGRMEAKAERLRERFEDAFWSETTGTYAIALDGAKRRCEVVSSNVGHVLYCGLASRERAERTAHRLLEPSMFSGWGLRTLSEGTARYNPMSYHNGSVWPHDTAIAAAGFARYGLKAETARLAGGLIEMCGQMDLARPPELFCGFAREPGVPPTLYPVACAPQAWASAAIYSLLQSCFGLRVEAAAGRIVLDSPILPSGMDRVLVRDLEAGSGSVDLLLEHRRGSIAVELPHRTGEVDVRVEMRAS